MLAASAGDEPPTHTHTHAAVIRFTYVCINQFTCASYNSSVLPLPQRLLMPLCYCCCCCLCRCRCCVAARKGQTQGQFIGSGGTKARQGSRTECEIQSENIEIHCATPSSWQAPEHVQLHHMCAWGCITVCVCECVSVHSFVDMWLHNVATLQDNPVLGQGTRHCATQNCPRGKFDIWVATPALTPTLTSLPLPPPPPPTHKTHNSTLNKALFLITLSTLSPTLTL